MDTSLAYGECGDPPALCVLFFLPALGLGASVRFLRGFFFPYDRQETLDSMACFLSEGRPMSRHRGLVEVS